MEPLTTYLIPVVCQLLVFDTTITNWGGIDVDTNFISTGYSSPKLIDSNGVYQLFVGSYSGTIYQFTNIDGNLTGQFSPSKQHY